VGDRTSGGRVRSIPRLALAAIARRRDRAHAQRALRDALRLLVAELEAGSDAANALTASAQVLAPPIADALFDAADQARQAGSVSTVLLAADPSLAPLGLAWSVAEQSGAALADVIGRAADDLDAALEQDRAVSVSLAGPRASALMLAGLPALGLLLGHAMGAHPWHFLTSGAGRLVAAAGLAFDAAGLWWTQRLIARALR
jgi:tight adherence protein B